MHLKTTLVVAALAFGLLLLRYETRAKGTVETLEHLTPTFAVEQVYPSMKGPQYTNTDIMLSNGGAPELLWIRGYEATMVGQDGKEPKSQQFMCHNTLSIHRGLEQHRQLFGEEPYGTRRLFTLSQGQYAVDFPEGFGIPVLSSERLMLQSQVLNLNADMIGAKVRHNVKAHFLRDREATRTMHPLCLIPSGVAVPVSDHCAAQMPDDPNHMGCALDAGGGSTSVDKNGNKSTGHWVVPPGRDVRSTNMGCMFPFDTTIHYIACHVHPGAESFELLDLTTRTSLFKAVGRQADSGVGLERISHYSSETGIPVFRNHEYGLVSTYNNQTGEPQSAMAFMFCYVDDKGFHRPDSKTLLRSEESFCAAPAVIR